MRSKLQKTGNGSDIQQVLGEVIWYFFDVIESHIKACTQCSGILNTRRGLQGNDIMDKIKELKVDNFEKSFKKFLSDLYAGQNYVHMDERTQKMVISNKSACRTKLTALENLASIQ